MLLNSLVTQMSAALPSAALQCNTSNMLPVVSNLAFHHQLPFYHAVCRHSGPATCYVTCKGHK